MKISFIEPHLHVYGGIRRIIELANRLSDRGHDVTIFHSDGSPCTWLECRAAIAPGRAVLGVEHDVVLYNDPALEDMYLANHARSKVTFYYVLGLYRKKLLHGCHPSIYLGRNARTLDLRTCLRSPHTKLANATWLQRWLNDHMQIESELLIGGINFELFHPIERERGAGTPFRILYSGDPREGKGTDTVREALDIVQRDGVDVEIETYYGKGIEQSNMAKTYGFADVFVDASHDSGGWNNPVAEAMACQVPVVSTFNGQVEDFAFDENTALMSPQQDARRLAANIVRIVRDSELRDRIATNAYKHIQTFQWDQSIDRFEEIARRHIEASR